MIDQSSFKTWREFGGCSKLIHNRATSDLIKNIFKYQIKILKERERNGEGTTNQLKSPHEGSHWIDNEITRLILISFLS